MVVTKYQKCIEAKDSTFTKGFTTKDADKSKNEKSSTSHFNSYAKRPQKRMETIKEGRNRQY